MTRILISKRSNARVSSPALRRVLQAGLARHGSGHGEISVLLTDDAEIRPLNQQWRGIDQTTDVLSWPGIDFPGAPLGDIAISLDQAQRQADHHGHSLEAEVQILAIHGALHLLGFDDETDADREEMLRHMAVWAGDAGIAWNPDWATRTEEAYGPA